MKEPWPNAEETRQSGSKTREKRSETREPRGVAGVEERETNGLEGRERALVGPTTGVVLTSHSNVYEPAGHFAI